jgi:hypothetical protein
MSDHRYDSKTPTPVGPAFGFLEAGAATKTGLGRKGANPDEHSKVRNLPRTGFSLPMPDNQGPCNRKSGNKIPTAMHKFYLRLEKMPHEIAKEFF